MDAYPHPYIDNVIDMIKPQSKTVQFSSVKDNLHSIHSNKPTPGGDSRKLSFINVTQ